MVEFSPAKATFDKENIHLGLAYNFRTLVHYHHGGKHGSIKTDMVLAKALRVLYVDWMQPRGDYSIDNSLILEDFKVCPQQ